MKVPAIPEDLGRSWFPCAFRLVFDLATVHLLRQRREEIWGQKTTDIKVQDFACLS